MSLHLSRRAWLRMAGRPVLAGAVCGPAFVAAQSVTITAAGPRVRVEPLRFPQDHGAHLGSRVEWWTLKGELNAQGQADALGFHLTVLRSAVESAEQSPSRFAPKQVLVSRASLSDPNRDRPLLDQRIARVGFGLVDVSANDLNILVHDWSLVRSASNTPGTYRAVIESDEFQLDLHCLQGQDAMAHGEQGVIHQDPFTGSPTRYYSLPQLKVQGQLAYQKQRRAVVGAAWLDHGWGKRMMAPDAVGSDWMCMNLLDGSSLMAFRMRRSDGSAVWEDATWRQPGKPDRVFKHEEIKLSPGDTWRSPATGARYPLSWRLDLGGTSYTVKARLRDQEVDGGNGIGDVFWEGMSDLFDSKGRRIGAGYLEMTGYAAELLL